MGGVYWVFFIHNNINFGAEAFLFYAFILFIELGCVLWILHYYIYIKQYDIDMQILISQLSKTEALKAKKHREPPTTLGFAAVSYLSYSKLFLFRKIQKEKKIDVSNIAKHIKYVFVLFYIIAYIQLVCFAILIIGIFF
jgi:hypothetical protein